jgi:hypothetical protein
MSLSGKSRLTTDRSLANDNFWPDVTIGDLTEKYRVPVEYADEVISTTIKIAILQINRKLYVAKETIENQGFTSLENYALANTDPIDDEEALLILYSHAVCCQAKAFLLKQAHTVQHLPTDKAAHDAQLTEDYWLTQAQSGMELLLSIVFHTDFRDPQFATIALL